MNKFKEYPEPIKVNVIGPGPYVRPGVGLGYFTRELDKEIKPGIKMISIFVLVMSDDGEPFISNARYVYPA